MTELKFLDLIHVIVSRRRSILVILLVSILSSMALSSIFPDIYEVKIHCLMPRNAPQVGLTTNPSSEVIRPMLPTAGDKDIAALSSILSLRVVEDIAEEIAGGTLDTRNTEIDVEDSGVISITTYSRNIEQGQQAALRIYDAMNGLFRKVSLDNNGRLREFIETELDAVESRRQISEESLLEYQRKEEIVNLDQELQLLVSKRSSFADRIDQAVVKLRESNGRLATLRAELRKAEIEVVNEQLAESSVINSLRSQIAAKEVLLATVSQEMTSLHPTMIQTKAALAELHKLLRAEIARNIRVETEGLNSIQTRIQSDYIEERISNEADQAELAALQEVYDTINEQAVMAPAIRTEATRLTADVARDRKIEEALTAQLEEVKIQGVRDLISFEILEGPTYPKKPRYPNPTANILMSIALALLISLVYCVVIERNDLERERGIRQVVFLDREMIDALSGEDA